jgi:hypothetical protein
MRGSMTAQIAELGDPALFDADFVYDARGGDITLDGKFNGLDIASLGLLAPDLAALSGSHLQFNGTVGTTLNIDGTLGAVHFSLGGGPGTIDLPSRFPKPLPIASLALVGQLQSGHDSLVVEGFTVDLGGPLISAEAKLSGLISYHVGKIGRLRVKGKARAVNVPVKSLPDLWPLSQWRGTTVPASTPTWTRARSEKAEAISMSPSPAAISTCPRSSPSAAA